MQGKLRQVTCPSCESATKTLETRRAPDGHSVRRRRCCTECAHRFTTYERALPERVEVIKRNGSRQPFDHDKLRTALVRACHKRDVDPRELESIVERVESDAKREREIPAGRIGELCLEGLAELDRGAYLQFAGTLPDTAGASS